jgi:hypothetical protein
MKVTLQTETSCSFEKRKIVSEQNYSVDTFHIESWICQVQHHILVEFVIST